MAPTEETIHVIYLHDCQIPDLIITKFICNQRCVRETPIMIYKDHWTVDIDILAYNVCVAMYNIQLCILHV